MSHVLELVTLQSIDAEVADLRASLAEAERHLESDEALEAARATLAAASSVVDQSRQEQRRLEAEIADLNAKITPEEKRLYGGSVHNPKELASIQHEVDLLKASRSKLEDDLLVVLTRLETETSEREAAAAAAAEHERRRESDVVALGAEVTRLRRAIEQAEAKSAAQRTKIPVTSLRTYDDVRRRKGGVAVARITGSSCAVCHVSLPDAIRRRALMSEIPVQCPNCDRVLYVS